MIEINFSEIGHAVDMVLKKILAVFGKANKNLETRFTDVYANALWGEDETRSGWGSRRDSDHVRSAIEYLEHLVPRNKIKSISDIPCGDFNWQSLYFDKYPNILYTGYDIVPDIITHNKSQYPNRKFIHLDITKEVPKKSDLILCKDMLNHLTYNDIRRAIKNMKRSNSVFLLASNDFTWEENAEVSDYGNSHRPVDITKGPLNFPAPLWNTHYMGFWRLADIPDALCKVD